jgi:hypothetical protein
MSYDNVHLDGIGATGPCGLHYEGRTVEVVTGSCAPIPELVKACSEPVGTLVPVSAVG